MYWCWGLTHRWLRVRMEIARAHYVTRSRQRYAYAKLRFSARLRMGAYDCAPSRMGAYDCACNSAFSREPSIRESTRVHVKHFTRGDVACVYVCVVAVMYCGGERRPCGQPKAHLSPFCITCHTCTYIIPPVTHSVTGQV